MRVYLAGPMSGRSDYNYPAFHQAAGELRALGHDVVSPAELHPDPFAHPLPYAEYIRQDLVVLLATEGIVLLPGWEGSRGARLEEMVASACGLAVLTLAEAEEYGPVAAPEEVRR